MQKLTFQRVLNGEVHAALLVKTDILHLYNVAKLEHVLNLFDSARSDLGDVNHAFLAGSIFHKASKFLNAGNGTGVDSANLGLKYDGIDISLGSVCLLAVDGSNANGSIVLNVDLSTGVGNDLLDHRAALTDNLADLVGKKILVRKGC